MCLTNCMEAYKIRSRPSDRKFSINQSMFMIMYCIMMIMYTIFNLSFHMHVFHLSLTVPVVLCVGLPSNVAC